MNPTKTRRQLLSQKILTNLQKRNITGHYAHTKEEAKNIALELLKESTTIGFGGSKSIEQVGIIDALKTEDRYTLLLRNPQDTPSEALKISRACFSADAYLCSSNAITEDGILVNLDANSNRVAAISFGPDRVIMIVGMNKVVRDEEAAISRVRNIAAPINAQRFDIQTPCKHTGSCANCTSINTICCQMLITRFSRHTNRIHVILIEEDLGF